MKLLYLSGPMTDLPENNYPAFHAAAARLRHLGYEVINPAETAGSTVKLPRETFLRIDLGYVMAAEGIVLLPGWESSSGSILEILEADGLGIPVFFYDPQFGLGGRMQITGPPKVIYHLVYE